MVNRQNIARVRCPRPWAFAGPAAFLALAGIWGGVLAAYGAPGEWVRPGNLGPDDFLSGVITAIETDSAGNVWVGTDRGLAWTADEGRTWNFVNLMFAKPFRWPLRPDDAAAAAGRNLLPEEAARRNTVTGLARGREGIWVATLNGLCAYNERRKEWYFIPPESGAPGPEIYAVEASGHEVWVSARYGIYRVKSYGGAWEPVSGPFPSGARHIRLVGHGRGQACWVAGFDSALRHGGGPDLLFSNDDGATWTALSSGTASAVRGPASARVHRIVPIGQVLWACGRHGLSRSDDGGRSWQRLTRRSHLSDLEVFDIAQVRNVLWAATGYGLYFSRDDGQTWLQGRPLGGPVSRLAGGERFMWLATGGGLVRHTPWGDWRSYSVRSHILALAATSAARAGEGARETWWAGTTGGLGFSRDRGRTWRFLGIEDGFPSNLILCLAAEGERVWAGTDGGIWTGTQTGQDGRTYDRTRGLHGLHIRDIQVADGTVYAATNKGLGVLMPRTYEWRVYLSARSWRSLAVLDRTVFGVVTDSSSPEAGDRLIYGTLPEENWRTAALPGLSGDAVREVAVIGRDVWAATDRGLYRSRDMGQTWARFGAESLRSSRVSRILRSAGAEVIVQAVPNDPPSLNGVTFLNSTADGGATWRVLPAPVPGHANALLLSQGALVVGTRFGLSVYEGYARDLRPREAGGLTWERIAARAAALARPDRLGLVSGIDRHAFHGPTLWLGSEGYGAVERRVPMLDEINRVWDLSGTLPFSVSGMSLMDGSHVLSMADAPDAVWFGADSGLFYYDRLGLQTRRQPIGEQGASVPVRAIAVRGSEVWVGTDTGLHMLDRRLMKWRSYTAVAPMPVPPDTWSEMPLLPDNRIRALACDDDVLWGGTARGGFILSGENRWMVVRPEERVNSIALGSVRAYLGTDRGLFGLDREDTGVTRRHIHKDQMDSALQENEVLQVFVDGAEVWAATPRGVTKVEYDRAEPPPAPPASPSRRGPEGVVVIVNDLSSDSRSIAREYVRRRGMPERNVCVVTCPAEETVQRDIYQRNIRDRVWSFLREKGLSQRVSFLVTTTGIPLKIAPVVSAEDRPRNQRDEAGVDSELTLLARPFPVRGAIPNPYLHRQERFDSTRFGMYLVARLDGPSLEAAIGMIRQAVEVETDRSFGSRGYARFDLYPDGSPESEKADEAILSNYSLLRRQARMQGRVALPERTKLPLHREDAGAITFFYLGRGAGEYRPEVFSWIRGAVGVCADRLTAPTLKDAARSWVAGALAEDLTATIGMVYDPGEDEYLSTANLYRYLQDGFTWAEAAYMCIPDLSWQAVVLGDPLYTPLR